MPRAAQHKAFGQQPQQLHLVQRRITLVIGELPGIKVEPVPHRDLMAPPQLAADAPRLDILQPVVIGLFAAFGQDPHPALAHRVQRGPDDARGVHEPLVGQHRLDDDLGPVAKGLHDRLGLDQRHLVLGALGPRLQRVAPQTGIVGAGHHRQPFGGDLGHHRLARGHAVKPAQMVGHKVQRVGFQLAQHAGALCGLLRHGGGLGMGHAVAAHPRPGVHQPVAGDACAFRHAIVVEIMRAGDLHRARAEGRIGMLVGDDRDQAAVLLGPHRDLAELADDGRIARVRRMHRHRAIAQHGFGAGGGDGDVIALLGQDDAAFLVLLDVSIGLAARQRVFEMPHMARHFGILDLQIGDRRLEMRIPVHQPLAAIDQPLVIHVDKDLDHRIVEIALFALGRALGA